MPGSPWNSLEWAKLFMQLAAPLAAIIVALMLRPVLGRIEGKLWSHQKVVEKRLAVFESIAQELDDIHCFFTYQGHWKQLDPLKIIASGRSTEAAMRVHKPLFEDGVLSAHRSFHQCCFKSEQDGELRLRTGKHDRGSVDGRPLNGESQRAFVEAEADRTEKAEVGKRYEALMTAFKKEMGIPSRGITGSSSS